MSDKRRNTRKIEIIGGLFMIISVLSMLIAFLMNFDYTVPNATFEEDVDFMAESLNRQRISAALWIISGAINLLFLPVYLLLFSRFQKGMHIFNGFLLLGMAFCFFRLGLNALDIANLTANSAVVNEIPDDPSSIGILKGIRDVLDLRRIGITFFGAFSTVFTISRFSEVKFPVFGSTLAFLAGPVVITFIWLNPDHILLNASLAVAWAGLLMIGVRLVNKGLALKNPSV
jgi:hypothetical protein